MKSKITNSVTKSKYPCLKCWHNDNTFVVLFTKKRGGIVVNNDTSGDENPVGTYATNWEEKDFVNFDGMLQLSN